MKLLLLLCFLPAFALAAPILQVIERDLNAFLSQIASLFPFSGAISDISGLLTAAESLLATLTFTTTTYNDLSGECKPVTVIFARGTTEPGNVGVLVGPPFFKALKSVVGSSNVAVQGVAYPADIPGFLVGGSAAGSQTMSVLKCACGFLGNSPLTFLIRATLVQKAHSKCPSTKIVMSGYSQGGQLVHDAAKLLPAAVQAAVSSVVIFGDPGKLCSLLFLEIAPILRPSFRGFDRNWRSKD